MGNRVSANDRKFPIVGSEKRKEKEHDRIGYQRMIGRKEYVGQSEPREGKTVTKIENTLYKSYKDSYVTREYLYARVKIKRMLKENSLDSVITIWLRDLGCIKERGKDGLS